MKARSDSWWAKLKPAERDEAYAACLGKPYGTGAAFLKDQFGVSPGSQAAYYRFFQAHADDYNAAAPVRAGIAQRYVKGLAEKAEIGDDEIIATLKADLAAAMMKPGDEKTAYRLAQTVVQLRRLQLDAERQRLDREKFEAAERRLAAASKTVADETLTDEERVAKVKNIFGIN